MTASLRAMLRFGSLHGSLESVRQEYLDDLRLVFGVSLHPPDDDVPRDFTLRIGDAPDLPEARPSIPPPDSPLTLGGTPERPTISTMALTALLELDRHPVDIRIIVLRPDVTPGHFVAVIHKILFHLGRVILHAAAVQVDGEVCLFVGDKGAGKSTTCLALARGGGTVLGEDQIVLRKSDAGYLVSGNDERSRVTQRTEHHFFSEPLAVPARDFAGTMKKEIAMKDFFHSAPFRDFPAHRLLFPRVTERFQLTPLKGQQALLRMMAYNGHFQRFQGVRDQTAFLDFLAGFIATVSCWELCLSTDLSELDQLALKIRSA